MTPSVDALLRMDGRVAVVTGGGGGIGAAISLRLAEAGAAVCVHYRSSESEARGVVETIEGSGGTAAAIQADVTRADEVGSLFQATVERFGRLDVSIHNAGIYPIASLLDMSEAEWDETVDANLKSVFLCTRAAARLMGEGSSIVNIASIEGERSAPGHSHYNASKAGVLMHTRSVAAELGPLGIRVNAVSPGLIGREGLEEAWPEGVERWLAACPLGRLGDPTEVADACLFLASDAGRWITGANLIVDGGTTAGPAF